MAFGGFSGSGGNFEGSSKPVSSKTDAAESSFPKNWFPTQPQVKSVLSTEASHILGTLALSRSLNQQTLFKIRHDGIALLSPFSINAFINQLVFFLLTVGTTDSLSGPLCTLQSHLSSFDTLIGKWSVLRFWGILRKRWQCKYLFTAWIHKFYVFFLQAPWPGLCSSDWERSRQQPPANYKIMILALICRVNHKGEKAVLISDKDFITSVSVSRWKLVSMVAVTSSIAPPACKLSKTMSCVFIQCKLCIISYKWL